MITVRSLFRTIITSSLLVSLSMSSFAPRIMACEIVAQEVNGNHAKQDCCCYRKGGHCCGHCGMACCQAQKPKQEQAPASTKPVEDRSQPLSIAQVAPFAIVGANGVGLRGGLFRDAAAHDGTSLVALSVRLNT